MTPEGNMADGPLLPRGGARNIKHRLSMMLTERDCRKVIGATQAAYSVGAPMTRYITLGWGAAAIFPHECLELTGSFIKRAREWMSDRGYRMPWVWVQESGERYGAHAHVLLHVPTELDPLFRPMPVRWAKGLLGELYVPKIVQSQALLYRRSAYSNPEPYLGVLMGKLHYMLKCAPTDLEAQLGLANCGQPGISWGQSCPVYGKRAGVWQGWQKQVGDDT